MDLVDDPCGAAFYGPKISVQARDAIGRTWQVSTIQLDFNLPERFKLEYIAADGTHQRPVMIHRALFGSIERFFAVLLEHYAGAFPAWLAPVQVLGVPVADEFAPHLQKFIASLEEETVRCEIDLSDDRFGKKIRNASKSKAPFILIVGEEDMNNNAVSFRFRDGSQLNGVPVDEAKANILAVIKKRVQVNTAETSRRPRRLSETGDNKSHATMNRETRTNLDKRFVRRFSFSHREGSNTCLSIFVRRSKNSSSQ